MHTRVVIFETAAVLMPALLLYRKNMYNEVDKILNLVLLLHLQAADTVQSCNCMLFILYCDGFVCFCISRELRLGLGLAGIVPRYHWMYYINKLPYTFSLLYL